MLWTIASIIFVIFGFGVAISILWNESSPGSGSPPTLRDLINILTAGLTLVGLAVAVDALQIANKTYQESVAASMAQQQSLKAITDFATKQLNLLNESQKISEAQQQLLQKSVAISEAQQEVLEKSLRSLRLQGKMQSEYLDTANAQLNLLREQENQKKVFDAMKPIAEVSLLLPENKEVLMDELSKRFEGEFRLARGMKSGTLTFFVKNIGNKTLVKPFIHISALPDSISVAPSKGMKSEKQTRNSILFRKNDDIEPFKTITTQFSWPIELTVPDSVNRFSLIFSFHGSNLAR